MSDTESESDGSATGWDAADFVEMSTQAGRIGNESNSTLELRDALQMLRDMDICAVEDDDSLQESLRRISSTILLCLDHLTSPNPLENDVKERRFALGMLLNPQSLSLLFEYRALFHSIAARSSGDSSTSVIVCWTDVILAKLGQAIIVSAGTFFAVPLSNQYQPDSVRMQKQGDMLRAAVQLPEKWADIINVLCSEHASPVAGRLAFSLVFGVNVMRPQLTGENSVTPDERDALLGVLRVHLKRATTPSTQRLVVMDASEQERIMYAIFVSLYAVVESSTAGWQSSYRPESQRCLSEMIHAVLQREILPTSSTIPTATLDTAVVILIKWGVTMPWAWATWEDARRHNAIVAELLTMTWLHNVEDPTSDILIRHSVEHWDDNVKIALEREPHAALSMMARILLSILDAINNAPSRTLPKAESNILLRTCWSTKHLLHVTDVDRPSIVVLYRIMCNLFVLMPDDEIEIDIKDLLIEVLSFSADGFRDVVNVISNPMTDCLINLDRRLILTSRAIFEATTHIELRQIRQTLQFMKLVWANGEESCFLPQSNERLLSALLQWVKSIKRSDTRWIMVGDEVVGVFATLAQHCQDLALQMLNRTSNDVLLVLAEEADPADLPLASSLAAYVSATANRCNLNALLYAETWDYLRDVLLLILTREFEGPDEPLALLIAPTICKALLALTQHADDATFHYYISSPWTTCMIRHLDNLRAECEQGQYGYLSILRGRTSAVSEQLCRKLQVCPRPGPHEKDDSNKPCLMMKTVFCWIRSVPHVILTAS